MLYCRYLVKKKNTAFASTCILYRASQNKELEFIDKFEVLISSVLKVIKHVIVCGDWNMYFCDSTNSKIQLLRSMFSSFGFRELVDDFILRVTLSSKTLLDNVVTTIVKDNIKCPPYGQSFSDHEAHLVEVNSCQPSQTVHLSKRVYSQENIVGFVHLL